MRGTAKGERFHVRLLPEEKEAFQAAAEIVGLSLSAWARERLRRASARELQDAGQPVAFVKPRI